MVLVDTSVLVDFFKGAKNKEVLLFEEIIKSDIPFGITSLIFQELLQGAKDSKEFNRLVKYLGSQRFLHPKDTVDSYKKAAAIYFNARRNGITIRSTIDCVIAQLAIEHNAFLLHNDQDFNRIAQFTNLKIFKM